ncbi:hypothetical protein J1614_003863 [Plenodomus biglobosus]|nr:hypothetical protein J1614_003863 [Plenodomus biglobosus]
MKLTIAEEEVLIEHILDLDARGCPPRLANIKVMADSLLAKRHRDPVGVKWATDFIKRRPELKVKFNRKYDYKRALCEDPEAIRGWFRLVENTKAKHGILDEDMYNFDETGFMMGQILTGAVVTAADRRGRPKTVQQVTPSNIQGGFRGAGLVPFDPEAVVSKPDVRLRTPPLPIIEDVPWQPQTPKNTLEFASQSTLLKERIQRHVDSSPTSMANALTKLAKGAASVAHMLVLSQQRNAELQAANEAATRRKSHKRKRLQKEGTLTVEEGVRLTTLREFGARGDEEKASKRVRAEGGESTQRRCKCCSKAGHNSRTCNHSIGILRS